MGLVHTIKGFIRFDKEKDAAQVLEEDLRRKRGDVAKADQ